MEFFAIVFKNQIMGWFSRNIDGAYLAQLMIDYNLGCATDQVYEVKKVDGDYFGEV